MNKIYKGNTPELYELFIEGEQLEYRSFDSGNWVEIPKYSGKPNDIYRVAGSFHSYRVKHTPVIVKKYTYFDCIERFIGENEDLNTMHPQLWYNNKDEMLEPYLEWTFTDNKLTSITIIGE